MRFPKRQQETVLGGGVMLALLLYLPPGKAGVIQLLNNGVKASASLSLGPTSMETFLNRAEFCLDKLKTCPKAGAYFDDGPPVSVLKFVCSIEIHLLNTNKSPLTVEFLGHPFLCLCQKDNNGSQNF